MGRLKVIIKERLFAEDQKWFQNCHANTQVRLNNGDMLVAFWAGTSEGTPDQAIWMVRYKDGAWQDPVRVKYIYQLPHWNPVLFLDQDGILHLYYKIGLTVQNWYTMVSESRDNGLTWTEAREAVPGDYTPRVTVRNKILIASNGDYIAPSSSETGTRMDSYADISEDRGNSWNKYEIPIRHKLTEPLEEEYLWEGLKRGALWENNLSVIRSWDGVIQPAMWESKPGHIHALMRSTRKRIYRSDSFDYGKTWCEAYPAELPNNCSGIDAVYGAGGILAVAYNPVPHNWGKRTPLAVSISDDNGKTFCDSVYLECGEGEFSYPSITVEENIFHVIYTINRKTFGYCQLEYLL